MWTPHLLRNNLNAMLAITCSASLHCICSRKNGEQSVMKEGVKLGSSSDFLRNIQKIFGKNIDGAGKRVLLWPSQDGAPAKAEDVTNRGGEISVPSTVLSESFLGKFREKRWRRLIQSSCWKPFPNWEALWNLLCAIDWDPQSTIQKWYRSLDRYRC